MLILVYILPFLTAVKAGSHSLMLFATYITRQTQFPEFSAVVMLDDVQLMYYDSNTWKLIHRKNSISEYYKEEQIDAKFIFDDVFTGMKESTLHLKNRFNYTDGFHVFQTVAGCELLDNDNEALLQLRNSFNGLSKHEWIFNIAENNWMITSEWTTDFEKITNKLLAENVIRVICFKHLRRYLHMEKNSVLRKVKPRVRLFEKKLTDSGGAMITCLATGFYPRHINLTLLKNGKPVEDLITGGELLPNEDGTYQMRKSLEISAEDLRLNYNFTCTATHLSLDNKLDISFELKNYEGSSTVAVVCGVVVLTCVTALIITALVLWRKRHPSGRLSKGSSQSDYTPASTSEGEDK